MAGAFKNSTLLTVLNSTTASSKDIPRAEENFTRIGGSISRNGQSYPENPLNSDEREKLSDIEENEELHLGIVFGVGFATYIILMLCLCLVYPNKWRRTHSFEGETMNRSNFCSRLANIICCKRKNEVKCPIQIIIEDYDEMLKMQQVKTEPNRANHNEQQEKNNTETTQFQILNVEVECHRPSTGLKSGPNETGASGLEAMEERQNDEDVVGGLFAFLENE